MSEGTGSRLAALLDGAALPEEEARALWKEFSEHMDEHRGDMAGFAKKKGWVCVTPEYRQGKAVLVARTTAAAPAPKEGAPRKETAPLRTAGKRPRGSRKGR